MTPVALLPRLANLSSSEEKRRDMRIRHNIFEALGVMVMLAGGLLGAPSASAVGPAPSDPRAEVGRSTADGFGPELSAQARKKYCRSNHHGSYVCFQPYGDIMWVKDTAADGYSAAAHFETNGTQGVCINPRGEGEWKKCHYDMWEDFRITFWAVNIDTPTNTYRFWSEPRYSYT
jgi:hypothetical protein